MVQSFFSLIQRHSYIGADFLYLLVQLFINGCIQECGRVCHVPFHFIFLYRAKIYPYRRPFWNFYDRAPNSKPTSLIYYTDHGTTNKRINMKLSSNSLQTLLKHSSYSNSFQACDVLLNIRHMLFDDRHADGSNCRNLHITVALILWEISL